MENTGEGRTEEGAREELLLMLEEARVFGI
jgi:hypothetical protein